MARDALGHLIAHYKDREVFPIKISDVVGRIRMLTDLEAVEFFPLQVNTQNLKGSYKAYEPVPTPYGENKIYVEIGVAEKMSRCWKRYVACKELMHIFDPVSSYSTTSDQIDKLMLDLTTPGLQERSEAILAEDKAYHAAFCVLAPLPAVQDLAERVRSGNKTVMDMATILRLPLGYMSYLMSPLYAGIYSRLLQE